MYSSRGRPANKPRADTAAMLFWALLASGQINMRKVDGWQRWPKDKITLRNRARVVERSWDD
jgi:hypothetical protein